MPPKKLTSTWKGVYQTFAAMNRAAKQQLPDDSEYETPQNNIIELSDSKSTRPKRIRKDSSDSDLGFGGFGRYSNSGFGDLEFDEIENIQASVSYYSLFLTY
jgi:hypothetical protein